MVTVRSYQQQQIMAVVTGLVYGAAGGPASCPGYGAAGEARVWGFSGPVWLGFLLTANLWGQRAAFHPPVQFFLNLSFDLDSMT